MPTTKEKAPECTHTDILRDYTDELKRVIQEEHQRLERILQRIDESMDAIHQSKKMLRSF